MTSTAAPRPSIPDLTNNCILYKGLFLGIFTPVHCAFNLNVIFNQVKVRAEVVAWVVQSVPAVLEWSCPQDHGPAETHQCRGPENSAPPQQIVRGTVWETVREIVSETAWVVSIMILILLWLLTMFLNQKYMVFSQHWWSVSFYVKVLVNLHVCGSCYSRVLDSFPKIVHTGTYRNCVYVSSSVLGISQIDLEL